MRKLLFLLTMMFVSHTAFGEKHEIGLTLGGFFPQDRGTLIEAARYRAGASPPNTVRLGGGTSFQANYGRRLISGPVALYGEVHFLANPLRTIGSGNPAASRDVATIYVTPGVRVKFAAGKSVSPYVAIGGGYAIYERSLLQIDGKPNPATHYLNRGAFDFGGGIDTTLWRWIGVRGEIRDFYTGSPAYNLSNLSGGQHNVVAGGGFVVKWGE